jgi:hypothetical protein
MQGIQANSPIYGVSDQDFTAAIWLYNFIPSELGVRVRDGSREFARSVPDASSADGDIRTLMYLNSVAAGSANDKYFACTSDGIFDVTAGGAGPHTKVVDWPIKDVDHAGWCAYRNYTNVGGDHFLLVTDEANGYYIYDAGLDTWAAGTFTGSPKPDAQDLVDITEWQGRIWFVERNTARAWFLDPLALTGDIAAFDVGNRFKKGGHLVQQTTWTVDDGEGMDDRFVQISSSGDLLVWQGINPTTAADMSLIGRWSVGEVPEGRRVLSTWGGDVMILSRFGLLKLSALLTGMATLNDESYISKNIARYFRSQMRDTVEQYGWGMEINPAEGIAIFSAPNPPAQANDPPVQFCLNNNTGAWSMFRNIDIRCMDYNVTGFFFGTSDGRVMEMAGNVDNATLEGTGAATIDWSMLTHYSNVGQPGSWKRGQFIRPSFIGEAFPTYGIQMRYDFNLAEVGTWPPFVGVPTATWDSAIWDIDKWSGAAQEYNQIAGLDGMGRNMAIAIRGESSFELSLIGFDIMFDSGGLL